MLIIILSCLIVAAGVCIMFIFDITKSAMEDPISAFETPEPEQQIIQSTPKQTLTPTPEPIEFDVMFNGKMYNEQQKYINIVLLGFDDMQDRANDGGNTDSLMVFKIGFETGDVEVLSIPRDTWTLVNEYDSKGKLEFTYNTKINAAYASASRRDDKYPNALATIENLMEADGLFDLDMDYYCSIDIKDVPKLCDAVGGVPIVLENSMESIGKRGETVVLNSTMAQYYLRDRKTGNGDISRGQRHQKFMVALAKKIQQMGGRKAALALYDDVIKYIKTNLSIEQIAALASLVGDINVDSIKLFSVPGKIGGASYERPGSYYGDFRSVYLVDKNGLKNIILDMYYEVVLIE